MAFSLLLFGFFTGSLLSVLVGLIGSHRRIGFGWGFLLSAVFTPLVGLICVLLSDQLPDGSRRWGCLGTILGILAIGGFLLTAVLLLGIVTL